MKKYIVFILLSMLMLSAYSQTEDAVDAKESKKLSKQERIEIRKAEEAAMAKMVDSLMKERKFILEADFLSNQTGQRINVSHNLNFILVDSSEILIQIASTTGIGGPNGMGGVTTRGRISRFEIKKTGKGDGYYAVRLFANTTLGTYDIYFTISPSSNADASLSGLSYGKLNYHGAIKPIEKSKAYKAMAI